MIKETLYRVEIQNDTNSLLSLNRQFINKLIIYSHYLKFNKTKMMKDNKGLNFIKRMKLKRQTKLICTLDDKWNNFDSISKYIT
jgi:hypothetical protein